MLQKKIKCVVWDLDNTIWAGTLAENDSLQLIGEAVRLIMQLDERGILQSIASRNDFNEAMLQLKKFGLAEYFLYPQINWGVKSESIKVIAAKLNINIDTFAFIDDQEFERQEVMFSLGNVACIPAQEISSVLQTAAFTPAFLTEDAKGRRKQYQEDQKRQEMEEAFVGSQIEYFATLEMELHIHPATIVDLRRAEELTIRTNQLNSTGITYSYDQLQDYLASPFHRLYICELKDRLGSYGKIGITLIDTQARFWVIKLLLSSCRVMSRGIGSVILQYIIHQASEAQVELKADYIDNGRNRMIYIMYKMAGFTEEGAQVGGLHTLIYGGDPMPSFPEYMKVIEA